MFVKVTSGQPSKYPYTLGDLRRDNPRTSFPRVIPDETLAAYGVFRAVQTARPAYDSNTQRAIDTVEEVDGVFTQVWEIQNLPLETASANVRAIRDRLLVDSDWTQLPDSSADTAAWAAYRGALRDITTHANFPYLAIEDWPTSP